MIVNIGGKSFDAVVQTRPQDRQWNDRESKAITADMTYEEAVNTFTENVQWSVVDTLYREDGTVQEVELDMSDYAMAGPITDNRDGTITAKMGKYLPREIMQIPLAAVPQNHREAAAWRQTIETAVQSISDDALAVAASPLHPVWSDLVAAEQELPVGYRFRFDGKLYRVLQAHTPALHWLPGSGTESLYVRIDEVHSGTVNDPIPYEGNMALASGLHYTQGSVVYLCNRDTVNPVYNALADLVGLYVEAVV